VEQVATAAEAASSEVAARLLQAPITIIRGLVDAVGFSCAAFASTALAERAGTMLMQVRTWLGCQSGSFVLVQRARMGQNVREQKVKRHAMWPGLGLT
jgi:hypothetical protein